VTRPSPEACLRALAGSDRHLRGIVADALAEDAATHASPDDFKETRHRIAVLVQQRTAAGENPYAVIDALTHIDDHLTQHRFKVPFATRLAAAAAEMICHAADERRREVHARAAAINAPIFPFGRNALCAVPPTFRDEEDLALFEDRLLAFIANKKTKRVLLVVTGEQCPKLWNHLKEDLKQQKVRAEEQRIP